MHEQLSLQQVQQMKRRGEKIVSLTAYDASFARIFDAAGVEIMLVGDSLGMVLHGRADTLGVTMDDMVYHSRLVAGATRRALLLVDMPYRSYETRTAAYDNARRLVDAGGAVVKLEGGVDKAAIAEHLVAGGIPVCGHIGLQPQSVKQYGGYKVQGRTEKQAAAILAAATALEAAGVSLLVLECIPAPLAVRITEAVAIPTIGIGAGGACDGQVLVGYDLLGLSARTPRMAKNYLQQAAGVDEAVRLYVAEVKNQQFPGPEHVFK